jgi:hypothetical protein
MKRILGSALCIVASGFAMQVNAQVSTLVNYPTADVLGHREFQINQNFSASDPKLNTSYVQTTNYLIGLFDRGELSANVDWLGEHTMAFKLTPYRSKDEKLSVGVGYQNCRNLTGDPFAALRISNGNWNLHTGWFRDDEDHFTLGVDTMLNDRLGGSLEYGSADSGSTGLCLYYTLTQGVVLQGILTKPNDTTADTLHTFVVSYTLRF